MASVKTEDLPPIPKEWNLSEQQIANMRTAQRKTIETNNQKKVLQQQELNRLKQNASMNPPEYPINVVVKDSNLTSSQKSFLSSGDSSLNNKIAKGYYYKQYYLTDSNNNYIFANSFKDALTKVQNDLNSPNSQLQKAYASSNSTNNKIRISSDNITQPPEIGSFSSIPGSSYKYWEINTTNATTSMFSNFRKSIRGIGGKNKQRNEKVQKLNLKKENINVNLENKLNKNKKFYKIYIYIIK